MDSTDSAATDTNQYARLDSGITENAGNLERPLGHAGGTVEGADGSRRADGTNPDGVSGDASSAGGTDSSGDYDLDGKIPITGWESERELLAAALFGGTDSEAEFEEADFGFAYSDYPADNLGVGSAYLAADVMNIIDNDSHTEDCTTQKQPPKNKKNTQSGGFNISM